MSAFDCPRIDCQLKRATLTSERHFEESPTLFGVDVSFCRYLNLPSTTTHTPFFVYGIHYSHVPNLLACCSLMVKGPAREKTHALRHFRALFYGSIPALGGVFAMVALRRAQPLSLDKRIYMYKVYTLTSFPTSLCPSTLILLVKLRSLGFCLSVFVVAPSLFFFALRLRLKCTP